MNFFSVKEYFYKVNTIGFILLLLPVIVFLYIHVDALQSVPIVEGERQKNMLLIFVTIFIAAILTVVNLIWRARITAMRSLGELSRKMEGYFVLFVIRNGAYAAGLLLMSVGYYVTHSIYFTGLYFVVLLLMIAQWPGPARFCMAFQLKGAERDLVLHNKDLLRRNGKTIKTNLDNEKGRP
jgi:hypothetical protein